MKSDCPKVLHEACGKPIVEYVLAAAKAAGSLKTYVVVGYKADAVKKKLASGLAIMVRQPKLSRNGGRGPARGRASDTKYSGRYFLASARSPQKIRM